MLSHRWSGGWVAALLLALALPARLGAQNYEYIGDVAPSPGNGGVDARAAQGDGGGYDQFRVAAPSGRINGAMAAQGTPGWEQMVDHAPPPAPLPDAEVWRELDRAYLNFQATPANPGNFPINATYRTHDWVMGKRQERVPGLVSTQLRQAKVKHNSKYNVPLLSGPVVDAEINVGAWRDSNLGPRGQVTYRLDFKNNNVITGPNGGGEWLTNANPTNVDKSYADRLFSLNIPVYSNPYGFQVEIILTGDALMNLKATDVTLDYTNGPNQDIAIGGHLEINTQLTIGGTGRLAPLDPSTLIQYIGFLFPGWQVGFYFHIGLADMKAFLNHGSATDFAISGFYGDIGMVVNAESRMQMLFSFKIGFILKIKFLIWEAKKEWELASWEKAWGDWTLYRWTTDIGPGSF